MKIRYLLFALIAITVSCKKNDDVKYDGQIEGPNGSATFTPISSALTLVNDTWVVGSNSAFPVKLTKSFQKDLQVTMAIDPTLAIQYDSAKGTGISLPTIPVGALDLANNGALTIKAGQEQSQDSVKVIVKNASLLVKGARYLVPITIAKTDGNLTADRVNSATYLILHVGSSLNSIATVDGMNVINDTLVRTSSSAAPKGLNVFYLKGFNQAIAPIDQKIEIAVNNDWVTKYNTANGTSFLPMPANTIQLVKSSVTIPQGARASLDSFAVRLPDLTLFDANQKYLLPIELKGVSGGGFNYPVDTSKKIVYVILTTLISNINPSNPIVTGTQTDRTNWVVQASGKYAANTDISFIKDNNYNTTWFMNGTTATPAWFTIDMGSVKNIKGFMFAPNYMFVNSIYVPTSITVQTSSNGTTWTDIGQYVGSNAPGTLTNPEKKYISFYDVVSSRYFRFNITAPFPNYTGMSEIFSYE